MLMTMAVGTEHQKTQKHRTLNFKKGREDILGAILDPFRGDHLNYYWLFLATTQLLAENGNLKFGK